MKLRKIGALFFYYNPRDRDYDGALKSLNHNLKLLEQNKAEEVVKNLEIPHEVKNKFSSEHLKELLTTIIINGFENGWEKARNVDGCLFEGNFRASDTINNPRVKWAIKTGLNLMERSTDPLHEISHIVRCLRFARYIYDNTHNNLDWGIIATAIVWHDISRIDNLGFLYRNNLQRMRHIPMLQDLNLAEVFFKDAYRSKVIMKKKFKRYGLDRKFIKRVGSAILGSDNRNMNSRNSIKKKYQKFLYDVDMLDLFSIGRWESSNRRVVYKNICDRHFLNRALILSFTFIIPKAYKSAYLEITKNIAKLVASASLCHARKFYPTDYYFASDSVSVLN